MHRYKYTHHFKTISQEATMLFQMRDENVSCPCNVAIYIH